MADAPKECLDLSCAPIRVEEIYHRSCSRAILCWWRLPGTAFPVDNSYSDSCRARSDSRAVQRAAKVAREPRAYAEIVADGDWSARSDR